MAMTMQMGLYHHNHMTTEHASILPTRRKSIITPVMGTLAASQAAFLTASQEAQPKEMPGQQRKVFRISRRKIKRVPVTSCDSCRLRKLKCNAKELPTGSACSQCAKHDAPCTFEDREEVEQAAAAAKMEKANVTKQSAKRARSVKEELPEFLSKRPRLKEEEGMSSEPDAGQQRVLSRPMGEIKEVHWGPRDYFPFGAIQLPPLQPQYSRPLQFPATSLFDAEVLPRPLFDMRVNNHPAWPNVEPALVQNWSMPFTLTDEETAQARFVSQEDIVDLLLDRFFSDPSFNTVIVPNKISTFARLKLSTPSPLPEFLLQTLMACAVASDLTHEPELIAWRTTIWDLATESVQNQLECVQGVEIELLQALLLLSSNWPGALARIERINTFDTAVGLATSIDLQCSYRLDAPPTTRAERIALFWSLYCYDKLLCSTTGRSASISSHGHDMPTPTTETLEALGVGSSSDNVCLQRLLHSFITLCQILEDTQTPLHQAKEVGRLPCIDDCLQSVLPLEQRLERFCKDNRWFLGNLHSLPPTCRMMAEAVVSGLHLTQLQLYVVQLRMEVNQHIVGPISFPLRSRKALCATIESSWHLVQQTEFSNITGDVSDRAMSFSLACALLGTCFFRFLAANWSQWDNGRGCTAFATWNADDESMPPLDSERDLERLSKASAPAHHAPLDAQHSQGRQKTKAPPTLKIGDGLANAKAKIESDVCTTGAIDLPVPGKIDQGDSLGGCASMSCDTASLVTMMLKTPARLLFQDDTKTHEPLRESQISTSPSGDDSVGQSTSCTVDAVKTHAMLTPLDPSIVGALCKVGTHTPEGTLAGLDEQLLSTNNRRDGSITHSCLDGQESNYILHKAPMTTMTTTTNQLFTLPSLAQMTWWVTPSSLDSQELTSNDSRLSKQTNSTEFPDLTSLCPVQLL